MGTFEAATSVRDVGQAHNLRRFEAELDPQWSIADKLHGGYLLAVIARAAARTGEPNQPYPTALSASFSRPPEFGKAVVEVERLRTGKNSTQLRARLSQRDEPCVEALITQGQMTRSSAWWSGSSPVNLPAEEDCVRMSVDGGRGYPERLMTVVETRIAPASLTFPTGFGTFSTWQRLADGSPWDPFSLLVALDPAPPASFDLGLPGWAPTLQLSAYLRRLPATGPLRVSLQATDAGADRMVEIATAWDTEGQLVGQATQFAGVRIPCDDQEKNGPSRASSRAWNSEM
ncbi:thioesterase family protein [Amycolatopsis sp. cg5]|uniref:thioesterase family protein n=1 Tax=Amycolatopsis sp. cg5 TaxID=3238802 RepID=UPI0035231C65